MAVAKSLLSEDDLYLFNEGNHARLYRHLGAHPTSVDGVAGTQFAVWAPNARQVSVVGDFNHWDRAATPLNPRGQSGIWEGFVENVSSGSVYKYHITSHVNGYEVDKADPFASLSEVPPKTASVVWDLNYDWSDQDWMSSRWQRNALDAPISIYEVHLGSWMRVPEDGYRSLSYRELAPKLTDHLLRTRFTHVEFMPVMEHPFFGSWGYQT
ncbi:MAG TPA: 1,4-alpha-glucan branching enzyme, partial [Nitrolancea sp.]|nr:1,4-alpha-glucan branching enzyme [Nitrolancea sp.]